MQLALLRLEALELGPLLRRERRICGRDAPPPRRNADQPGSNGEDQERPEPKQQGLAVEARLQQNELAVTVDQEIAYLRIAAPGRELLADKDAQVMGELGVGFIDRFVLADEAAELAGEQPRARLELWIAEHLTGLDGERRARQRKACKER